MYLRGRPSTVEGERLSVRIEHYFTSDTSMGEFEQLILRSSQIFFLGRNCTSFIVLRCFVLDIAR